MSCTTYFQNTDKYLHFLVYFFPCAKDGSCIFQIYFKIVFAKSTALWIFTLLPILSQPCSQLPGSRSSSNHSDIMLGSWTGPTSWGLCICSQVGHNLRFGKIWSIRWKRVDWSKKRGRDIRGLEKKETYYRVFRKFLNLGTKTKLLLAAKIRRPWVIL